MADTSQLPCSPFGDDLPLERLESELTELAGRIAAATCRWLMAVASYDRREGWGSWGCRSMVHWLSWRCGVSAVTAREHVRVARALEDLPVLTAEFAAGRLSYSQIRALTRVATQDTETYLAGLAHDCTANQLDRIITTWTKVREVEAGEADPALQHRGLWSRGEDDGTVTITARLPAEQADALLRAVDATARAEWMARRAADDGERGEGPGDRLDHPAGRRVDALAALVERAAGAEGSPLAGQALTVIHVDHAGDRCHSSGQGISRAAAERAGCDSLTMVVADRADGTSVDAGRQSRRPTAALRRAVLARDRCCVFPGCSSRAGLHIHHVRHWSQGGPTDLANLAVLCGHHHRRVHEGGWHMAPATGPVDPGALRACPSARWAVTRPDGKPVPPAPSLVAPSDPGLPPDPAIGPDTIRPQWDGTKLDAWCLSSIIDALLHHANHPPSPERPPAPASAEAPDGDPPDPTAPAEAPAGEPTAPASAEALASDPPDPTAPAEAPASDRPPP